MAREYGKIASTFWTGETGRAIRNMGGDAQRVALYLLTCPLSNMIGLYYLPIPVICHEVGISQQGALKALRSLSEGGFAYYSESAEHVFVPAMAAHQVDERLSPNDNRVKAVAKEWQAMRKSPFYMDFYKRYVDAFHLPEPSPFEAPSKPLRSQEQEQEQEQEQDLIPPKVPQGGPKRFTPPSLEEVRQYCLERGKGVDPEAWYDHYTANGWKVGKNAMKDWRAAVRQWERSEFRTAGKPAEPFQQQVATAEDWQQWRSQ